MATINPAVKEFTDLESIEKIIRSTTFCHVGLTDGNQPYVLAFNFGYQDNTIYIHCGKDGRKLDILRRNNKVCVQFQSDLDMFSRHEQVACSWRQRYRSAMAFGKAYFIESYDEKIAALQIFMKQYAEREFKFNEPAVNNIEVIKIEIDTITGRSFEY